MRKLIVDDSSNVRSITYRDADPVAATASCIEVEFRSGATYRYAGCSIDDFATACHAPSVGRWVQEGLVKRPDRHPHTIVARQTSPQTVDARLVTLQVIASMSHPKGMELALVEAARAAVQGLTPPALSERFPTPVAMTDAQSMSGPKVLWGLTPHATDDMTPDEAEGVAYALLVAALEARS